ncbi:DinB family protein [Tepidiforma sp.]|uniref:DinB family protein n=1 Tax=Tepidiforma sp. TaxID=2682230 RepID=UPI002ADDDC0E|nr:DinB family protein [Tepidiforma sp.]
MTFPDEERQRIRSYLVTQAAERSIEELIGRVDEGVQRLLEAARAIAPDRREVSAAEGEWSPAEALRHVAEWHARGAADVLHVALTGERPAGEGPQLPADWDGLVRLLEETTTSLFEHVRAADPGAFLEVRWEHPFFGMLNWREWLLFLRLHALDHARQLGAMAEAARA